MAEQHKEPDRERPLEQPVSDPFTGIHPAGPIQPGSAKGKGWPLAASWFLGALLIILVISLFYWLLS